MYDLPHIFAIPKATVATTTLKFLPSLKFDRISDLSLASVVLVNMSTSRNSGISGASLGLVNDKPS